MTSIHTKHRSSSDRTRVKRKAQGFSTLLSLSALLTCSYALVAADPVYKSIDAAGNVTYSSSPPTEQRGQQVEEVKLTPGPSPEQVEAADKRIQEIEQAELERSKRRQLEREEQNKAKEAAEAELRSAQQALEQARIQRYNNSLYPRQGDRTPMQEYLDRVSAAEARVREANGAASADRR